MALDDIPPPGQDLLAVEVAEQPETNVVRTGTVLAVSPLTLNIQGGQALGSGYVGALPAVGDVVAAVRQGESWLVLGKINSAGVDNSLVGWAVFTATSAFVAAETVMLTIPSVTFAAGHAYEIDYEADVEGSVNSNQAEFKVRRTGIAGATLRHAAAHIMSPSAGIGTTCKGTGIVANYTGSNITDAVVLTLGVLIAGTVRISAGTNRLARMRVREIGPSVRYPSATGL